MQPLEVMFKLEFEGLLMSHKRFELNAFQRLKALSIFSAFFCRCVTRHPAALWS